ncbi:Zinc finger protein [Plecturocebus cupreus]
MGLGGAKFLIKVTTPSTIESETTGGSIDQENDSLSSASEVARITGVCHQAQQIFVFLVETGFHHIGQAGLKLLTSGDPLSSASQSAYRESIHRPSTPFRTETLSFISLKTIMQLSDNMLMPCLLLLTFAKYSQCPEGSAEDEVSWDGGPTGAKEKRQVFRIGGNSFDEGTNGKRKEDIVETVDNTTLAQLDSPSKDLEGETTGLFVSASFAGLCTGEAGADFAETGFHHIGQAGLKLLTSSDPPTLASQSAGIIGHAQSARVFKVAALCPRRWLTRVSWLKGLGTVSSESSLVSSSPLDISWLSVD